MERIPLERRIEMVHETMRRLGRPVWIGELANWTSQLGSVQSFERNACPRRDRCRPQGAPHVL